MFANVMNRFPLNRDRLIGDTWGGLAAMLVALPSAIAFGVTIFAPLAGSGSSLAAQGALAGILGATALGLVAPACGGTTRLSGLLAGVFALVAFLLLAPLIAWVPVDALATTDCEVYVLARERFEMLAVEHGDLLLAFFGTIARTICTRLRVTITELQALRG
jgi:MFS superfamily sulfate permease-like transporter